MEERVHPPMKHVLGMIHCYSINAPKSKQSFWNGLERLDSNGSFGFDWKNWIRLEDLEKLDII